MVDDTKLAGEKQNIDPMWKIHMRDVDVGEPTSFLDHVYLSCTQREFKTSKDIVDNYKDLLESRMSAGGIENLAHSEKSGANIFSWSYDMGGHLANKTTQQFTESQLHVLTTTNSWKKKWDLLENCQKYARKLF